jgi:hypothetical protein
MKDAKFFNLAKQLFDKRDSRGYKNYECINYDYIKNVVNNCGATEGDILYLGAYNRDRPEYGFAIKTKDGFTSDQEAAYSGGPRSLAVYTKGLYPNKKYKKAMYEIGEFYVRGLYFRREKMFDRDGKLHNIFDRDDMSDEEE